MFKIIYYWHKPIMVSPMSELPDFIKDHECEEDVYVRNFATSYLFNGPRKRVSKNNPIYACYVNKDGVYIAPVTAYYGDNLYLYILTGDPTTFKDIAGDNKPNCTRDTTTFPYVLSRYKTPYDLIRSKHQKGFCTTPPNHQYYVVVDGVRYNNYSEASKATHLDTSNIRMHALATTRTCGPYTTYFSNTWTSRDGVTHTAQAFNLDGTPLY